MTTDQAIRLVYLDLDGQLTDAEREALQAWERADPAHRRISADTRRAWQAARPAEDLPFALDVAGDFERVRARTRASSAPVVALRRRPWLRIAAAVALLAVSVFALRWGFGGVPEWQTARNTAADPITVPLPDGSTVWLNAGAELAYPAAFGGATRTVRLDGEAFFEVEKDAAHPFVVATANLEVTVLGTAFNVRTGRPAVSVREGRVRVAATTSTSTVVLAAGEGARLDAGTDALTKISDPDGNAAAWQRGYLRFADTPLRRVLADLSAHYATPVLADAALLDCTLSGRYGTATALPALLDGVAGAFGATVVRKTDGRYVLKGGSCQ